MDAYARALELVADDHAWVVILNDEEGVSLLWSPTTVEELRRRYNCADMLEEATPRMLREVFLIGGILACRRMAEKAGL